MEASSRPKAARDGSGKVILGVLILNFDGEKGAAFLKICAGLVQNLSQGFVAAGFPRSKSGSLLALYTPK